MQRISVTAGRDMMTRDAITPVGELEMVVGWEGAGSLGASFCSGIDGAKRTIRVKGGGIWRGADAERYFEQQGQIVAEARRRYGTLRVFFDVRDWVVEGPHSALQFQTMNTELYRPDDRIATVVASSLLKPYPRTALGTDNREAFISMIAAERWLQAYSDGD